MPEKIAMMRRLQKKWSRFLAAIWISGAAVFAATDFPPLDGTHIYLRGGRALSLLPNDGRGAKLLTVASPSNDVPSQMLWNCIARSSGGMLFHANEKYWRMERSLCLIGETLPPGRASYVAVLAPLPKMEDDSRSHLLDLRGLRVWKISADSKDLPERPKDIVLTLVGKTEFGNYDESVQIKRHEKGAVGEAYLLSLARSVSVYSDTYANETSPIAERILIRDKIPARELRNGQFRAGNFLIQRERK